MSRILILGSTGMLGTMVSRYFLNLEDYDVALTTRAPGQESNESYIFKYDASVDELDSLIQKVNPDYVINCIGIIKPEIDEANQQSISNAININSYFPLRISNNAEFHKFKYIQIGTDCVFSGNTGNYVESSFQDAEDVYGKSKIGGEVVHNYKQVVRASIVGPEIGEGKSLLNWFLSQEKNEINGFKDHLWNGITTLNFAKIAHGMIKSDTFSQNLQHLIPKDIVSKFTLLEYFKNYFDIDIKINEINSDKSVNRTLNTENIEFNNLLWMNAGYDHVPTIEENIKELAESDISKGILS